MGTVAITGASGFLGGHLAEALREEGWRVRAIVRAGSPWTAPGGVERVEASLDVDELSRAADGADVLVHSAALVRAPSERVFEATNVGGTRAAVGAANSTGARLVYISSQAAAGTGTIARPRSEDDPPRPVTAYGRSKLAGEEVVRAHAQGPWTIVRPVAIYGPRDRGFLPLFRMAARGFFPLVSEPQASFSLIHVREAVLGIRMAFSDRADRQTFFLTRPPPVGARVLLEAIALAVGRRFRPLQVPPMALRALARCGDVAWRLGVQPALDSTRFAELRGEGVVCTADRAVVRLGFRAETSLSEGVGETARWY
ncbi:MAG: NAD-dependent epimerase/dehydratase family protein, partial [Vicinamibacterales bacterium]